VIPDFLAQALTPARWPAFVLLTTRLSGLMITAPLWSMSGLPRLARAAIVIALAVLLLPAVPPMRAPESALELPLLAGLELLIGLAIGLSGALLVQGVVLAGEVISLQMGLSLAPQLAPMPDLEVSGVGMLMSTLALLLYAAIGGHLALLRALADSLRELPPGAPVDLRGGALGLGHAAGALFSCGVRAAAPIMVALFLANLALALLSRAVPQINTMMVSLPITVAIGLVMLGAALPFVASTIDGWVRGLPEAAASTVRAFGGAATGP